jgi:type I restriction enzyme S subunit
MSPNSQTLAAEGETNPALVPKLRFPDFRWAEGWSSEPLGEIYSFKGNNSLSRDKLNYVAGSVKNIHYGDIHTKFSSHFDITKELVPFINQSEGFVVRDENLCAEGDMVFADASEDMADIGKSIEIVRLSGERLVSGLHTILARPTGDRIAVGFGGHLFKSTWVRTQIQKEAQGAKVLGISANRMRNLRLPLPRSLAEQQKIAECLSSLDDLMAAQARKVDALKTHKKGLMQQLFPREGETQPRLRFPEFQNAAEWSSLPLGDLGEIITGKTPNTKEADLWGGDILFITPTDISEEDKYQRTTARTVIETKSTKILPAGSIVYTCIASIGKMALTVHPSITNQQINAVVPNEKTLEEFIYYALVNLTPWIKTLPATNTLPIINKSDFSKIAILFPEDKAEQHRIASCLSSLDALITAATQKLETLKAHKRGLMQQLFPSPEETADL